jgi:acyl-CoA thioesterase FadM
LNFSYQITDQRGRLVLEGETFHACARLDGKPRRLPQELRELLSRDTDRA